MAYHIDVTGKSGNITQIQYDRLKADEDSYVILRTDDGVVRQLNFALERANVLLYSKIHGQNSMIVEVNPNLSYSFRTETIETTENKTETITADSTTTEYPTAKTAFEYINSVVGISTYPLTVDASNIEQDPSNPTKITNFTPIQLKFTAKQGYYLPDNVAVTNATGVWNKSTGTLTISEPKGNVSVAISGSPQAYRIATNLTNVKAVGGNPTVIYRDSSATLKFTASDGYELPVNISKATNVGSQTWDRITGTLKLFNPTADVTVTLSGVIDYVEKYTSVTLTLSQAKYDLAATTVGDYALFGGGIGDSASNTVDAYDASFTKTIPTTLSVARYNLAATNVGDNALFGGGQRSSQSKSAVVDAYDVSLTRTIPTQLSNARCNLSATNIGNYALFGGGLGSSGSGVVDAYDASLTRTIPTELSAARRALASTTVGDYALFGGGIVGRSASNIVDAYDTSLTRTIPTELSSARSHLAATTVGNYALFGGGSDKDTVDAYDTNLTKTIPTALSKGREGLSATTAGSHALFGGGGGVGLGSHSNVVDAYDTSLTRTIPTGLSSARPYLAATSINNYVLFGGGGSLYGHITDGIDIYESKFISFTKSNWATIAKVFKSGQASKVWNVGDTKTITTKSGKQYTIRIADMQTGRYAYADGSRSSNGVLEFVELINLSETTRFQMNELGFNEGGFASSKMRNTFLPNILSDLPDDMQAAISEVNVLSGTGSRTTSGTSSSANKLFLPAEMEMFDAKHYSIGLEECPLGQFDYYKAHNTNADRIKKDVGTTNNYFYWLRSPYGNYEFCYIIGSGECSTYDAGFNFGVSPIFAI